jgi:hypothetical protein
MMHLAQTRTFCLSVDSLSFNIFEELGAQALVTALRTTVGLNVLRLVCASCRDSSCLRATPTLTCRLHQVRIPIQLADEIRALLASPVRAAFASGEADTKPAAHD